MMEIIRLTAESFGNMQKVLLKRSPASYPAQEKAVNEILSEVRERGDAALFEYTEKFDGVRLDASSLLVGEEEVKAAYGEVDVELLAVIRRSIARIRSFHEKEKRNSWFMTEDDMVLGQRVTPLARVGVYVPGGKAAYPSSVLMNVIPAQVAGVPDIVMCTPPGKDGRAAATTVVAAKEAGVKTIYKVGGAQAVAAMAYGTELIPKVDKITGPGNIFVALAKKAVYGNVSIDSVAGPSEVTILADETANAHYVAADLLSQTEHDELACGLLVTTSRELAEAVSKEVDGYLPQLSRREIIEKSLASFGRIFVADTMEDAVKAVDEIAPEHLEIVTKDPFLLMTKVHNAGAMFIGEYSSEPLGDYMAGPNHVLPTNGTAAFFSPLSVDDFVKKSSVIYAGRSALSGLQKDIRRFAEAEGLTAHANSIKVRFED